MPTFNRREQRGLEISKIANQIKRIDANSYIVKSQSDNGEYSVSNALLTDGNANAQTTFIVT